MHPEKYTLTWHSYRDYLQEMMREMMTSEDFADVILVTDDKKTIKAHRNILSACSPVFKNILQMEITNNHPVIYLRGIQYSEMESILQFIYFGQAKLYEEQMNKFMLLSKNLDIKGLIKDADVNEPQIKRLQVNGYWSPPSNTTPKSNNCNPTPHVQTRENRTI